MKRQWTENKRHDKSSTEAPEQHHPQGEELGERGWRGERKQHHTKEEGER